MLTTVKTATGTFDVYWNGERTGYTIVNGSLGLSGRDSANMYGYARRENAPRWIGSLTDCKKMLATKLART